MASVALTFDDGPDAIWTPRILDALLAHRITATFFVMAQRAARHPDLLARMLAEGHEVELHCLEHVRHDRLTEAQIARDADDALALLAEHDVHPRLWRTPWGVVTEGTERVAVARGLRLVGWTDDTHDWRGDAAEQMLGTLEDFAIVLAHDGLGPGALRDGCGETERLVELLAGQAHVFTRVPA